MQLNRTKIIEKSLMGIAAMGWILGLLIAGSDSPYMPWLNGLGVILFLGASLLMKKLVHLLKTKDIAVIYPKLKSRHGLMSRHNKNKRFNTKVALGI